MKAFKNLCSKLLILILVFVTSTGLVSCKKNDEGLPTDKHIVMMTATSNSVGEFDANDDYWEYSSWTVYYDGVVEYSSNYNISGALAESMYDLSEEDLKTLYTLITEMNEFEDCEVTEEYGISWYITYFDTKGNLVDSFSGDVSGKDCLTDIEDILENTIK
ncbi:MAG: hypothetical protein K6F41_08745 [Lachnospira sp.]|uniref:DUF4367 domain-containing protein n=1 Tax=Lachnospira pectinoschiza TaxID=28052 RepID=A0A1G9VHB1_9FIRM|nr:hypothetical protein [Lachnospira pectinoschiza]MCR5516534.1 hypothetical protein [Lachnospira sp.]SDM71463.1 hypothetical protein SAMN05216544_0960 [Lachnospira pectinoschiza]